MAADLSRVRLNSLLDFAGVELKQGGVLLDADANESMAIIDRRLRALASDVLGRATVSATTPDAFKITLVGGELQIGRGRLYVDGLLAETHGAASDLPAKRAFDDLLSELMFTDAVAYDAQPYLPQPPNLPTSGRHLLYLDVWNREVTHLENPELVESAVGVETASRIQTVWQVRALAEDAGNSTCASPDADLDGWSDLIAPSTGVLTTGTYEVAPVDDPCELPATGGYRGLENQLYRVEIHDPGQPGAGATFVWSRENASIGSVIASVVSSTELELPSVGRDDVLRFNTGDWVEIADDVREFSQAAGEIRRITLNEATRRISFSPALPPAMRPSSFPDSTFPAQRHLRVRRWDHKGKVFRTSSGGGAPVQIQDLDASGSTGVINVPAAGVQVLLENGVTVSFDSTGNKGFRAGDYWVFAARTSDASVELLQRAPPRGTHHHYARLAIWDVDAGTVTDCRNPWPPAGGGDDCSCSACVTPESHSSGQFTIQDAVNRAIEVGGTVCLRPGVYALKEPVRVVRATGVRIRGQGGKTVIVSPAGAFRLETCIGVGIENLAILSVGNVIAIDVQNALGLSIRELAIALLGGRDAPDATAIGLSGIVAAANIRDNAIFAPNAIVSRSAIGQATTTTVTVTAAKVSFLLAAALSVEDNYLWCERQAVMLGNNVLHMLSTSLQGNQVVACRDVAFTMLGFALPGSSLAVRGNSFSITGDGIRCGVDSAWIDHNKVVNTATGAAARASDTVGIALVPGLDRNGSDQCQILANQVSGFRGAGIRIGVPTRELMIKLNIIDSCGNGIVSTDQANGGTILIENNQLANIGPEVEDGTTTVLGVGIRRARTVTIAGNVIRALGLNTQRAQLRAAIFTLGVTRARVFANEVSDIGPAEDFIGVSAGIMIRAPFTHFDVSNNHVQRDATTSTAASRSPWQALVVVDVEQQVTLPVRGGGFTTVRLGLNQLMVLGGGVPFIARAAALQPAAAATGVATGAVTGAAPGMFTGPLTGTIAGTATGAVTGAATAAALGAATAGAAAAAAATPPDLARGSVLGNTFIARGPAPAVEISAHGECLFSENRVEALLNQSRAVVITTGVGIINSNRVRGGDVSIHVLGSKQIAVLGNITTGEIIVPNGLQTPWDKLNLNG